jgi:2,4-dienoyl-CoA reductase-like NADH-dependent reductase (Old Yellow Enzyme family)
MPVLFDPLTIRGLTVSNRIWVSPMCQYSADTDGLPRDWHLVHLGQFAVGRAGLVMTEATAVCPEGRLSPMDTGLWNDRQAAAWSRIVAFVHDQGSPIGVQLVHAGRKGSTSEPWTGTAYVSPEDGGWQTVGPSSVPFGRLPPPDELDEAGIDNVVESFAGAAEHALRAGFDVIELHAAHGYILHQFASPLANFRTDQYGGSFDNRIRLITRVLGAVRERWPAERPLFLRLSATDWTEGGWSVADSVRLAQVVGPLGVDLIDCSSGGIVPGIPIPVAPNYQVTAAEEVRRGSGLLTAAVGLITSPTQADRIISSQSADAVFLAREMLRDPHFVFRAAKELGVTMEWPIQYWEAGADRPPLLAGRTGRRVSA